MKLCYDIPGHERIICFLKAGDMASSMSSFHALLPSRVAIVALDETVVRKVSKLDAEAIATKHP